MKAVIFALEEEAKQVLEGIDVIETEFQGRKGYVYSKDGTVKFVAIVSGVGKVNAQLAVMALVGVGGVDEIINIGTCGCTSDLYKVGELVEPNVFFDGDFDLSEMDVTSKDPSMVNTIHYDKVIPCYSYSTFITDKRAQKGIVDMEAYAVVAVARFIGIPVRVLKVVSDSGSTEEFNGNVDNVITVYREKLKEVIL